MLYRLMPVVNLSNRRRTGLAARNLRIRARAQRVLWMLLLPAQFALLAPLVRLLRVMVHLVPACGALRPTVAKRAQARKTLTSGRVETSRWAGADRVLDKAVS